MTNGRGKVWIFGIIALLLIFCIVLADGAFTQSTQNSGPTATDTPEPTHTETATETPELVVLTETPIPTETLVPTDTPTPFPTFDETAFAAKIYSELTATAVIEQAEMTATMEIAETAMAVTAEALWVEMTATEEAYWLMQTPTMTPTVPDEMLTTGLKMINPEDGKELFFIESGAGQRIHGFWIDWNEVSNGEYQRCVEAGSCTVPHSDKCGEAEDYYISEAYGNYPVVNVSMDQAAAYCRWAGMDLMNLADREQAVPVMQMVQGIIDLERTMPGENGPDDPQLVGNVWEWTGEFSSVGMGILAGGSWKTSAQDIRLGRIAEMNTRDHAEDVGFRCVKYVYY